MVPQWDIEAILVDDLRRLGVEVEHNVEVTGFEQSHEGVVVHAKNKAGESVEVPGSYFIGAEVPTASSARRSGSASRGPYPQGFLLADCKIDWPLDYDHMKMFLRGRDLAVYLPLKGKDFGRIVAVKPAESDKVRHIEAQGSSELPSTRCKVRFAMRLAWTSRSATRLDLALSDPPPGREQVRRGPGLRCRRRGHS